MKKAFGILLCVLIRLKSIMSLGSPEDSLADLEQVSKVNNLKHELGFICLKEIQGPHSIEPFYQFNE